LGELNPFFRQDRSTQEEEEEDDHPWQIAPEMTTLAATVPKRDWGVDHEADHQLRSEADWEYSRQNEEQEPNPRPVEGMRHWLTQIEARAGADVLLHEDPPQRELKQDVGDVRQALRNDSRFDLAANGLTHLRIRGCLP
jgi:hypothetical protein